MIRRSGRWVRGRSLPGAILWSWEPPVPHVHPSLLQSSVFQYGSVEEARHGEDLGGSGFLVGIPSEANPACVHLYVVSNIHVIESCPVSRIVKADGTVHVLDRDPRSPWIPHPADDDVAVRPLGAVRRRDYCSIGHKTLLKPTDLRLGGIGPGDDCLMFGRYVDARERQFDRPVVRFGNLAMLPELVRQRERAFDQESFLVDMRSVPGYSGSPVLVYYEAPGFRTQPHWTEDMPISERVKDQVESGIIRKSWLLGIDWGHLEDGMAAAVPAWKLAELLELESIVDARNKADQQLADEDSTGAVLDVAERDEFERFEDLTRKLINVPKREIDERRKDES